MNFCPHCHSGNDPVLKDTTWSCGVRFNDSTWRTKECFKRNLESANDRIKRLEEDSERLNWLLDRGLAWRDCYDDFWKEGEWLYASQSALETIDKAKEAKL